MGCSEKSVESVGGFSRPPVSLFAGGFQDEDYSEYAGFPGHCDDWQRIRSDAAGSYPTSANPSADDPTGAIDHREYQSLTHTTNDTPEGSESFQPSFGSDRYKAATGSDYSFEDCSSPDPSSSH